MKVKSLPEDFIVEEISDVAPGAAGEFTLYRLDKTGWTTPDAVAAIRRRWRIDHRRLSYGGLKDRHAVSSQFLSIRHGPERNLTHERIQLTYLGRTAEPYSSRNIRANRFTITLRAIRDPAILEHNAAEIAACGVPNYFDDQRFGSVGTDGRFIALEMVKGRFEDALKLALAAPYEFDRSDEKREKAILREHWGDWPTCKARLARSHARSLVDYLLHHPGDFKGAVARLRPEFSTIYLSAYQSHIWNRLLSRWIKANLPYWINLRLKLGDFPAPRVVPPALGEAWESLTLPLPSARLKPEPVASWLPLVNDVLAEDGITLETLRIPGLPKPYFSKGHRPACLRPIGFAWDCSADDRHPGRKKVTLRFELPRGAYATMIVKRLTSAR